MSRPEKIKNLQQLGDHIDAWALQRGLNSRFGTFTDMYERRASYSSIAKTFDANYRTALNWIAKYEIFTGVHREREDSETAQKGS